MDVHPRLDANAPWKQRFRAPSIAFTKLATSQPTRGVAVANRGGEFQLFAWDVPSGQLYARTSRPEGMAVGAIAPDGRHLYYLDDQQGSEVGHYVRVPFEGGPPKDITPRLPAYSPIQLNFSRSGRCLGFIGGSEGSFSLYVLGLDAAGALTEPREIRRFGQLVIGPWLSPDGDLAFVMSTERTGRPQFSLLAIDTESGDALAELFDGGEASLEVMATSPRSGDPRVLAATNRSGAETLLVWNPRTGERQDLSFPGISGAMRAFDWSPSAERVLFRTFNQGVQQLYVSHLPSGLVINLAAGGVNVGPYFATETEIWSHWQDPSLPSRLVAFNAETGAQDRTVLAAGDVPAGHSWQSVTFQSSDGQVIQGWLGLPAGRSAGPFPTILETHGGPESVSTLNFSPQGQAWVDHGFAYLTINYRGSTTFGREFQQKIWGQPGHWEVEDMVAARSWLVAEGISRPDQVFLTGWSYGGYLTLLALGKRPDLWAGGLAGIAIADWVISYEDSAEFLRAYQRALFQGTPAEKPEQYRASSPITYADQVTAPVLIIQGRNDTRTPARPIELYEQKLRALGKPIAVHWFEAGHMGPFAQVEQAIEHQAVMQRFAAEVLARRR